jgi:integrase
MTTAVSPRATARTPVVSRTRRVPGLFQRSLADGSVVYDARLRLDGRVTRIKLDARTKTDAIREIQALRVDQARGEHRHRSLVPPLTEIADEWIAHLQTRVGIRDERRRYSQRTVDLYRQRLRDHVLVELGPLRVEEISVDDVRKLVDRLSRKGLAPGTVTSCVNILSGLLRFAVKRKLTPHNVVTDLDRDDRPGTKRLTEPRNLSADEIESLLARLSDTFRPVAYVCVYAGLRISETLGLRWRDLDLKAGTIGISGQLAPTMVRIPQVKSAASEATMRMLPALRRELVEHRRRQAALNIALVQPDALVFVTARRKPQSRRNALRALHKAGDAAGLNPDGVEPAGLHDLRHSLVAFGFAHRLSAPEIAVLARHANANVTLTVYAGLTDSGREQAATKLVQAGFGR